MFGPPFPLPQVAPVSDTRTMVTRIVVKEDRTNTLAVPESRVRPGFLEMANTFGGNLCGSKPKRIYDLEEGDSKAQNPADGSVVIFTSDCEVMLQSVINKLKEGQDPKGWAVLTKMGVNVSLELSLTRPQGQGEVFSQYFKVSYNGEGDWGCIVFRCGETLCQDDKYYKEGDILSIFFFKDHDRYEAAPYPPVVTMTRLSDQNYIPMLPGQILQLVPPAGSEEIEDHQSGSDRCLIFHGKETISKSKNIWVQRFECIRPPEVYLPFFVRGEKASCSVIVPPLHQDGKDVYVVVPEPYKKVRIDCTNLTSIRVQFARAIPVIDMNRQQIEIPEANTDLNMLVVNFLKQFGTLTIESTLGKCEMACWLSGVIPHFSAKR